MKIRDRRGWKVPMSKGRPVKNAIRIMRRMSIYKTIKFRHL